MRWIVATVGAQLGELPRRVDLNDVVRRHEHGRCRCVAVGVALTIVGEGVGLEVVEEVRSRRAGQVVQPIAVLQILHLRLEHEVEGRAQHAAELRALLGQPADPQIDAVEAAEGSGRCHAASVRIGSVQEGQAVEGVLPLHRRRSLPPPRACQRAWVDW